LIINTISFLSIDASKDDGRMGRLINDSKNGNCKVKPIETSNGLQVCIFALKDIPAGLELRYDYKDSNLHWRKRVCFYE